MSARLPDPSLTRVYRLEATVGEPLDLGDIAQGRRRIVPLTGGTFTGPELNGKLLPGSSADWQTVLPDGTALGDIRCTLETDQGHRRIVPLTGGTFTGPELNGKLLPGSSADWQIVLPDGTAVGDIRYTLQTDGGDLLYVQSRGVRHGSADVLERLARGEDVDATEYTFRACIQIETAAPALDWLNKGVFISVGGRRPGAVIYETYLVG